MQQERAKRGLQDGNDRVATIARWLRSPPSSESVSELVLWGRSGDDESAVLGRWPRERVSPDLAPELSALVQDYADDMQAQCTALLAWTTEDGAQYASKPLRARPARSGAELPIETPNGDMATMLQQSWRHNEIVLRQLVEVVGATHEAQARADERTERLFGFVDKVIERLERRADEAEQQVEAVVHEAETAKAMAEEAIEQAETAITEAEEAREGDKLAKVLEIGTKALGVGK